MQIEIVQPAGWKAPSGYANGIAASGAARLLFGAGQVAWDAEQRLVGPGDEGRGDGERRSPRRRCAFRTAR